MREILFRGKRTNNGEWEYGFVVEYGHTGEVKTYIVSHYASALYAFEIDPSTVGQYTGLTDKTGKKIWEGDIINSHYANAAKADFIETVVFHNGKFCGESLGAWALLADGIRHVAFDKSVYMESCEIIGNVYDNPELVEAHNGSK